jgi:hypothetical protein
MGQTSYVKISLAISSHETEPETITQRVGLQPTSTRRQGTPVRNGLLRRPEFDLHEWWIDQEMPLASNILLDGEAKAFFTRFFDSFVGHSEKVISALSKDHSVVVIVNYHMNYMPYIGLTKDHVQALARLGAGLDFDFFIDELEIDS